MNAAFAKCSSYATVLASLLLVASLTTAHAQPIGPPIPLPPGGGFLNQGPPLKILVSCKPIEAGSVPERIHVKCEKAIDNRFDYFYVNADDPRFAARALSVIEAAQLGDKYLNVLFDVNATLQLGGCPTGEVCRQLLAVTMVETPLPPPNRCVFNANRPGCPAYCAAQDDINCAGFCDRHPTDQDCSRVCTSNPNGSECQQFCAANPTDTFCGSRTCQTNSFSNECKQFCQVKPQTSVCVTIRAECQLTPFLPGCS